VKIVLLLVLFWTTQVIAQGLFGWGVLESRRWWTAFILGNGVGLIGTVFLLKLYAGGDTGLACALAAGGAFVLSQIILALVAWRAPTLGQWACIVFIAAGMTGYALLGKSATRTTAALSPEVSLGAAVLAGSTPNSP
jgi:hypothetical protein